MGLYCGTYTSRERAAVLYIDDILMAGPGNICASVNCQIGGTELLGCGD